MTGIGLRSDDYGTHSLRRTKASIIYKQTGNLRAVQILLGHAKLDNTAFYTKVATRTVRTVTSPLDKLGMFKAREIAPTG